MIKTLRDIIHQEIVCCSLFSPGKIYQPKEINDEYSQHKGCPKESPYQHTFYRERRCGSTVDPRWGRLQPECCQLRKGCQKQIAPANIDVVNQPQVLPKQLSIEWALRLSMLSLISLMKYKRHTNLTGSITDQAGVVVLL